jgi:hypothetical protein
MFSFLIIQVQTQKTRIIIVIETLQTSKQKLNRRRAALIYKVPENIFYDRITSRTPCNNTRPTIQNLTETEKQMIVNHILDLDSRGFSPRQANIEDIANYFCKTYRAKPVGKL